MGYTPPQLEVRKVSGGYYVYPPSLTSGDDLTIFANGTDALCCLNLNGNSYPVMRAASTSALMYLAQATDNYFKFYVSGGNTVIVESVQNNYDLKLNTTGTGVLSFGTYTGGAATDSTGYITIKDAAGNTRKLMVQA